jgi:hypothetical protein
MDNKKRDDVRLYNVGDEIDGDGRYTGGGGGGGRCPEA